MTALGRLRRCCSAAFLKLERRAAKPLFPPHVWKLDALVSGTAVMLGVTGILVGAVFLTSIFLQTVLGFSALRDRPRVPAVRARHHRRHRGGPAPAGPPRPARRRDRRPGRRASAPPLLLSTADGGAHFATRHPARARRLWGSASAWSSCPVSVTSMAGIPRLARRRGLRVPDDRPRGRRRPGRRRPVRRRQHRRH